MTVAVVYALAVDHALSPPENSAPLAVLSRQLPPVGGALAQRWRGPGRALLSVHRARGPRTPVLRGGGSPSAAVVDEAARPTTCAALRRGRLYPRCRAAPAHTRKARPAS